MCAGREPLSFCRHRPARARKHSATGADCQWPRPLTASLRHLQALCCPSAAECRCTPQVPPGGPRPPIRDADSLSPLPAWKEARFSGSHCLSSCLSLRLAEAQPSVLLTHLTSSCRDAGTLGRIHGSTYLPLEDREEHSHRKSTSVWLLALASTPML